MKCTNKKILCIALCILLLGTGTGCGEAKDLPQPYDVFAMADGLGIGTPAEEGADNTYFAESLCVADDAGLGTESPNSQVAEAAGAFNLATNSVVYAKNLYEKLYPASTTKILTAYIALKYSSDLDAQVTVSQNAVDQTKDSSVCKLNAGDVISLRALLYGLLLQSGNDAAIAIAEHVSGSVEEFCNLMNQEARALGATQSHFVNPNGLPDENHYTSAYDLYLIFNEALKNETFVSIISAPSYDATYTSAQGETVEKTWENTNKYVKEPSSVPEGFQVIGGKTGTTKAAGYCLVLYSYNPQGQPIISIVLKADGRANLYLLMDEILEGYAK